MRPGRHHGIRLRHASRFTLLLILLCAAGRPAAAAAWDYYGLLGLTLGRTDNPAFEGGCNPNYTPTASVCALPADDPRYDPLVCEPEIRSDAISGDITGSVQLTGGLSGTWAAGVFDLIYAPSFHIYQTGDLNELGHALLAKWRADPSPRATWGLSEDFTYTPEQEVDPNALSEGLVLLNRTTRSTNDFRASYDFETTPRTTLGGLYRWHVRSFGAERFIDSSNHNVGLRFTGRFNTRTSLGLGYEVGQFDFGDGLNPAAQRLASTSAAENHNRGRGDDDEEDDEEDDDGPFPPRVPLPPPPPEPVPVDPTDPISLAGLETPLGTVRHQAYLGYVYDTTEAEQLARPRPGRPPRERRRGVTLGLQAGYHRLIAPDAEEDGERSAPYIDGSVAWHAAALSTTMGYVRGLSDGGGAFANAESQNVYADMRFRIGTQWRADVAGSYLVHERIEFSRLGSLGDDKVRTFTARTGLGYDLSETWLMNGTLTYYRQEICGDPCSVIGHTGIPELSTYRFAVGLTWLAD
ncbi:MAG TPA: hypothetical protein VJV23_13200 [Candidatus Polarisedimenticolia bacterium]|nr:hypothetical protein [Candidatus Polarisedimenticolia bacterium]